MAVERGRKPRGAYKQKTQVFSTRIRADTKAALEAAAKERGHSLSQEIEHRLRRSFDEDRGLTERFGDRRNYAVLRLVAALMGAVTDPLMPESAWLDDPRAFDRLVRMVDTVFSELRPLSAAREEEEIEGAIRNVQSAQDVALALLAVRDADPDLPLEVKNPAAFIRADLGAVADRIGRQKGRRVVSGTATNMRRAAEELEREGKEGSNK